MNKWIFTLSLMGALAVGANADVTKDTDNCYMIGTPSQLLEFAEIVNAASEPDPELCGKLTANIEFNPGQTLLNENMTGFKAGNAAEANNWTPMKNFSGKFDGKGYSISGIYYGHTPKKDDEGNFAKDDKNNNIIEWPDKAGLFINLGDGATVKNLRIVDSYFGASLRVGSIAAEVTGKGVTIDRCSFAGLVSTILVNDRQEGKDKTANQKACESDDKTEEEVKKCKEEYKAILDSYLANNVFIGGLTGVLETSASLTIQSSINIGTILQNSASDYGSDIQRGGIIGLAQKGSDCTINNTHGAGLVAQKAASSITNSEPEKIQKDNRVYCLGTGKVCNVNNCDLENDIKKEEKVQKIDEKTALKYADKIIAACEREYMREYTESFGFKGVSLKYGTRDDGRKIVIAHITENDASRDDNVLQELVIPEDFPADSVDFDRPFKENSSTVMIPFDIAAANVKNYDGVNVLLGSVKSISCKNDEVKECEANAANAQSQISAHTPYLVSAFPINQDADPIGDIPIGRTIHFHGPVVLKKIDKATNPTGEYKVSIPETNWTLVGTYKTLITTSKDDASAESDYEKVSKLGKIFGFVGSADVSDGGHDFTLGEFARAGHNVRTREMRSYLIYNPPEIQKMAPAINGVQRAAALSTESAELPSSIPVTFESRPIIPVTAFVDTTLKPTTMVSVIFPTYSDEDDELEDSEEEGTTAITKPFMIPMKANKIDRWQDAMGRRLNGKPTKHGTYFKNGIPVIIK